MESEQVARKLLEGLRCCSECEAFRAAQPIWVKLIEGVQQMQTAGCAFTDEEVEVLTQGEVTEQEQLIAQYAGGPQVHHALNLVFDREAEWSEPL